MYRTNDQNDIKCVQDQDGSTGEDAKRMAHIFNQHYINVDKSLAHNINTSGTPAFKQKALKHSFFIRPTSPEKIKQIIDEIKSGKAPGYDNISVLLSDRRDCSSY
ncbi:uncharacterized protein LOC123318077 isoform X2 [Coccinella septempunctata]|uniref:uncharacterized protein LOC123318077 isoform X2 n=1 Tax=Coccinella septempunctata TaxID=41139 RepID=UPI001D073B48|nr:uncharacterized protein LOC123318077 isoform X2 [Coccinella septempunctata]XP_044760711.1 uncharacterized protein LOC123318077 isoform X2 [Coccinella septempunctata]